MHPLEQKVWGDFKVQFKSPQAGFYFWLNVSAILYNNELKNASENLGSEHDPIYFNEFEEIEETELSSDKNNMLSLLLPNEENIIAQKEEDLDKIRI